MPAQIQYGNFITSTTSTADRTLSWVYGPEHQRIKEQVTLSGSGTSSYFAGSTWYLNGEDSLGLSYEKEIRTNGTIEQKHYVSAGGQVFALFVSRSGTLNGLPATSTSYMHQDHLSSVSVITDETGAVVERLAYDPWGKRRKIDGNPDKLDAIVGLTMDRGYTMHEHLDEVGIIHMNGRIYDPLIGRFMSADPYVQAPTNLKTFNRYSYVWNNPLKHYDPEGFTAQDTVHNDFGWRSAPPSVENGQVNKQRPGRSRLTSEGGGDWRTVFCGDGATGCADSMGRSFNGAQSATGVGASGASASSSTEISCRASDLQPTSAAAGIAVALPGGAAAGTGVLDALVSGAKTLGGMLTTGAAATVGTFVGLATFPSSLADGTLTGNQALSVNGASDRPAATVHGNSDTSPTPTTVYQLISNSDGSILKYGITGEPNPRDRYPDNFYNSLNATMVPIMTFESRGPARVLEVMLCSSYVVTNGELPPASVRC